MSSPAPLPAGSLRWTCDPAQLAFASTEEVAPTTGIIGQELAREALEFGLACRAPGQNVFVRGPRGTGRMRMIRDLLEASRPLCTKRLDRCYVHNFLQPDRPRLVSLPRGQGRKLRRRMRGLADFVARELEDAMHSAPIQSARTALDDERRATLERITRPFEDELAAEGLALVQVQAGPGTQPAIYPTWEGQVIAPEQMDAFVRSGRLSEPERDRLLEQQDQFTRRLPTLAAQLARAQRKALERRQAFDEDHLRRLIAELVEPIKQDFNHEALNVYLDETLDDVVEHVLHGQGESFDPYARYGVNVLTEHFGDESPVVVEANPTLPKLLGTIEARWTQHGRAIADYRGVRSGSLLEADGGFLVLDAHDVLAEPGAWPILTRTLRTGQLEIVPSERPAPLVNAGLKPEPIPISVRVILLGDPGLYRALNARDADFSEQFKVLADFSAHLERSRESVWHYAGVLSRIAREEGLRHFSADAVAALAEHGARIAGRGGRLSARFGRVADIAREADWLAGGAGCRRVTGAQVREAVVRTKRRASLPVREFQQRLEDGTVRIDTHGTVVGQINGLAVMRAGPLTCGFPARITATIGPGTRGVIDIESQSRLSGAIHTKGFQILGGLLRHLLRSEHPLAFSSSLAFEQSYGGIDGDSASGAELLCMLSALTDVPLRQDLAITGAIDQHGALQAVGGVNEKIEGFFDICRHFELTGSQGVVIPAANASDLMLRTDVVEACAAGRFAVYAVDEINAALALFTGREVGSWDAAAERYTPGSLLDRARMRAREFWRESTRRPDRPPPGDDTA